MSEEKTIVFDVKRTLTSGNGKIMMRQGHYANNSVADNLYRCPIKGYVYAHDYLKLDKECTLTKEMAFVLARRLRDRKIANLKKQIERLESLQFTIEEY